ncbi:MAG: amidohydrolase [Oligoflexia bacterium]|nr:amidohydrolase [Oligoflexia bacterium]MBF0367384.1 amidohydrolase [Oligoflexia bacterium]
MLQTLLYNGAICTKNGSYEFRYKWLAVRAGRVWHLGEESGDEPLRVMKAFISSKTKVIDLQGGTLFPAFFDSHLHLLGIGRIAKRLNLSGVTSLLEVRRRVSEVAAKLSPGEWILGRGWDQNLWEGQAMPTLHDLDDITASNPVFLVRVDGHAALVNSAALKLAGVTSERGKVAGGEYTQGLLIDNAISLVEKLLPEEGRSERLAYLESSLSLCKAAGLGGVVDVQVSLRDLDLFANFFNEKRSLRVFAMIDGHDSAAHEMLEHRDEFYWKEFLGRYNSPFFKVVGMKFYADGALGSRGALLKERYADAADADARGLEVLSKQEMQRYFEKAFKVGLQVSVHALGDLAVSNVLDVGEAILAQKQIRKVKLRIEHLEVLDPKDIARMQALLAVASIQAVHLVDDSPWLALRLGEVRTKERVSLWRSLLKGGVLVANGTDAPIANLSPIESFLSLITRKSASGAAYSGINLQEALTAEEALEAMTESGFKSVGESESGDFGKIAIGRYADFTLLSKNILSASMEEIRECKLLLQMVAGECTFE